MRFVHRHFLQVAHASIMRHLSIAFGVSCLLLCPPLLAQDNLADLYGVWRLTSFTAQIVGGNAPPTAVWGPNPRGYLIFMPNGRMMAHVSAPDRKPPKNDADSTALLKSMNAYTGTYTIEGDKWTTVVDQHHNEIYVGVPQVRYFKLDGDKLYVRVPEQPSALFPGKRTTAKLEFVRER
jgi:hypothetical protein